MIIKEQGEMYTQKEKRMLQPRARNNNIRIGKFSLEPSPHGKEWGTHYTVR